MLVGVPPFYSRNLHVMYRAILHGELHIPRGIRGAARSLLERLLQRDPSKRLGTTGGADRVKRHRFFRGRDFARVLARGYAPLFPPPLKGPADTANFDPAFTEEPVLSTRRPGPGTDPGTSPGTGTGTGTGTGPSSALPGEHAEASRAFVGWDSFSSGADSLDPGPSRTPV